MIIRSENFEKFVSYSGRKLNAPAQALIIGGTAIAFIPPINRMNKKVDQDTRDMAVGRSIGKNIVGNLSDYTLRVLSIALVSKFSKAKVDKNNEGIVTGISPKSKKDIFTPSISENIEPRSMNQFSKDYRNYKMAMGALLATALAIFVKTTIELPLTKKLTDIFYKREKAKQEAKHHAS